MYFNAYRESKIYNKIYYGLGYVPPRGFLCSCTRRNLVYAANAPVLRVAPRDAREGLTDAESVKNIRGFYKNHGKRCSYAS